MPSLTIVLAVEAQELWQRIESNLEWVETRAQRIADAETDRSRALDAKASQVLAVAAVATSIAATALAPRLPAAPPGARILASVGGVNVLVTVGASVAALFPRSFPSFATPELEQWPTVDFLTRPPREVKGLLLNGWLGVIAQTRRRNRWKVQLVRLAVSALGLALCVTTAAAAILAQ